MRLLRQFKLFIFFDENILHPPKSNKKHKKRQRHKKIKKHKNATKLKHITQISKQKQKMCLKNI